MRGPEWQGRAESALQAFWPERDKSREREGRALAVKKLSSFIYDSVGVLVRQLRGPHLST
jgi:hypothetical protein